MGDRLAVGQWTLKPLAEKGKDMPEQVFLLKDAASRFNLPLDLLTRMVQSDKIEAVELPNGEFAVSEPTVKKIISVSKEEFKHLSGVPISVSDAAQKYDLKKDTVRLWTRKGYITVLETGYRMQLDEGDVAYCAAVYHKRDGGQGKKILDESGQPYTVRHPDRARYRREYRRRVTKEKRGKKQVG